MSGATRSTEKDKADALETELKPLVGGPIVAKMFKYDTDPPIPTAAAPKIDQRKYRWPLGARPDDHPSLSDLGL